MEQKDLQTDPITQKKFPYPIASITVGGVDTIVTKAESDEAFATVHLIKGFKSSPYLYKDLMETLTDHGINVVLISLPDPEDEIDFMDEYEHIAKAVYIDGELDYLHDENLPKIAASHSIGGFLITKLLTEADHAQKIKDRYESMFFASPFYGSKYHSIPLVRAFAYLYSVFNANAHVGTTWLERQFIHAANDNFNEGDKALANHKQALYMNTPTNELINKIRDNGLPDVVRDIPATFHMASFDQVSFNALTTEIAKHFNSKLISSQGGHSHIRETDAGRRILAYEILDVIQRKYLSQALKQDDAEVNQMPGPS